MGFGVGNIGPEWFRALVRWWARVRGLQPHTFVVEARCSGWYPQRSMVTIEARTRGLALIELRRRYPTTHWRVVLL